MSSSDRYREEEKRRLSKQRSLFDSRIRSILMLLLIIALLLYQTITLYSLWFTREMLCAVEFNIGKRNYFQYGSEQALRPSTISTLRINTYYMNVCVSLLSQRQTLHFILNAITQAQRLLSAFIDLLIFGLGFCSCLFFPLVCQIRKTKTNDARQKPIFRQALSRSWQSSHIPNTSITIQC